MGARTWAVRFAFLPAGFNLVSRNPDQLMNSNVILRSLRRSTSCDRSGEAFRAEKVRHVLNHAAVSAEIHGEVVHRLDMLLHQRGDATGRTGPSRIRTRQ